MKKAFPGQKEVFIRKIQGKLDIWDVFAEEIVGFANEGVKNGPASTPQEYIVWQELCGWMNRYLEEGITDDFLNDLNNALHEIHYSKHILPLDLLPSESGFPRNAYIAEYDNMPEPEAYAADDFSKLLTTGMLSRLKRCRLPECEKFFLGPPQRKWCSDSCGSTFRVRKKRKQDSL